MKRTILFSFLSISVLLLVSSCGGKSASHDHVLMKTLKSNVKIIREMNKKLVENMRKTVDERGNIAKELKMYKQAQDINNEAQEVTDFLDGLMSEMEAKSGGLTPTGLLLNPDNTTTVSVLTQDNRIQEVLNAYVDFLNKNAPQARQHTYFALDGKEHPFFDNNADFVDNYFNGLTVSEAMVMMLGLKMQVAQYEMEVLKDMEGLLRM